MTDKERIGILEMKVSALLAVVRFLSYQLCVSSNQAKVTDMLRGIEEDGR